MVDAEKLMRRQERIPGPDVPAQHEPDECRLAPSAAYLAFLTWGSYADASTGADGAVLADVDAGGAEDKGAEDAGAEDGGVLGGADVVGVGALRARPRSETGGGRAVPRRRGR